jgi:hypothetical protein
VRLLRAEARQSDLPFDDDIDPAFAGDHTMLNQEQGVRGLLSVANDFFFLFAHDLKLETWEMDDSGGSATDDEEISAALKSLSRQSFPDFSRELARAFAIYDWRSADAPALSYEQKLKRRAFRGSGGYAALREDLLRELVQQKGRIAQGAKILVANRN